MITKLEIKNFRNIKNSTYEFNNDVSILCGKNGIGKSNTLNAIVWLISSTIYTDSQDIIGKGDMDTIIPNDYVKGMDTEVSITIDSKNFTKKYRTTYKRGTDEINGHTTDFAVNDIPCSNEGEFTEQLYPMLHFTSCLDKLKVKEVNLFTDPLYALQKLDSKELRKLLVALGCSVENEEIYKLNPEFEKLRQLDIQNDGKFDVIKKLLNQNRTSILKDITTTETQLGEYTGVAKPDEAVIKQLNEEKAKISESKSNLINGSFGKEIETLEAQIKTLNSQVAVEMNYLTNSKKNELESLTNELQGARLKHVQRNTADNQTKIVEVSSLKMDYALHQNAYNNFASSLEQKKSELVKIKNDYLKEVSNNEHLIKQYNEAQNSTFNGYVTCPHCGGVFAASEEDLNRFNQNKTKNLVYYKSLIQDSSKKIADLNAQGPLVAKELEQYPNKLAAETCKLNEIQTKIDSLNKLIEDAKLGAEASFKSIEQDYQAKILKIKERPETSEKLESYKAEIASLVEKKNSIQNASKEVLNTEIYQFNIKLEGLEKQIEEYYVKANAYERKTDLEARLSKLRIKLNDLEVMIRLVTDFVNELLSRISTKALEKTGISFVLLEEQLNGGLAEVCYATVNGVPFDTINTSQKVEIGVKFIEKVKDIVVNDFGVERNTLPILADRFESIDNVETIRSLTPNQLICTRVTLDENITLI